MSGGLLGGGSGGRGDGGREWPKPGKEEFSGDKGGANVDWGRVFGETFGTPDVPAAKPYTCQGCQAQVLSQDVEWREDGKPHCPDCGAVLKEAE